MFWPKLVADVFLSALHASVQLTEERVGRDGERESEREREREIERERERERDTIVT